MPVDHGAIPGDPTEDRDAYLSARNRVITDARLGRIASLYASAETTHPEVINWAHAWRDNSASAPWLLLCGPVGSGKTHNAIAGLRLAVQAPRTVCWEIANCSELLDALRPGGPEDAARRYQQADILIVDDVTMTKAHSDWAIEKLYQLVDYRRRTFRATVVTSNKEPGALEAELNEQIVSRIAQSCVVIALSGDDQRYERRPAIPAKAAAAPLDPTVRNRSAEVLQLLTHLRAEIPKGDPDQLRWATKFWKRTRRHAATEPNPHFRGWGAHDSDVA